MLFTWLNMELSQGRDSKWTMRSECDLPLLWSLSLSSHSFSPLLSSLSLLLSITSLLLCSPFRFQPRFNRLNLHGRTEENRPRVMERNGPPRGGRERRDGYANQWFVGLIPLHLRLDRIPNDLTLSLSQTLSLPLTRERLGESLFSLQNLFYSSRCS